MASACRQRSQCLPLHWARLLASMAAFGHRPSQQQLQQLCLELQARAGACEPAYLAQIAAGIAAAGHRPSASWLAVFLDEACLKLPAFRPADLVTLLEALVAWQYCPSNQWLQHLASATAKQLPNFTSAQLPRLLGLLRTLGWRQRLASSPGVPLALGLACLQAGAGKLRWVSAADMSALLRELPAALNDGQVSDSSADAAAMEGGAPVPAAAAHGLQQLQGALPRHLAHMTPLQRAEAVIGLAQLQRLLLPGCMLRKQQLSAALQGSLCRHVVGDVNMQSLDVEQRQHLCSSLQQLGVSH